MPDFGPSWNVAPQTFQPVIRLNRDTGEREIVLMRRGLVPFWARDAKVGYSTINAQADTITISPTYREAFKHRRCLVPADAFYEWVRPRSRPADCPAWSRDRTCRPIGSACLYAFTGMPFQSPLAAKQPWIASAQERCLRKPYEFTSPVVSARCRVILKKHDGKGFRAGL
jgi:putative SOS response-associated peptidase YedK